VLPRQFIEGQQLGFGGLQEPGHLRRDGLEPVDHLDQPLAGLGEAGGLEDPADGGGDHGLLGLGHVAQHVAQEVDRAPLPRAAEHLGDRLPQTIVGVRDAQAHALESAGAQAAEELAPERLGLSLPDVQADDLTAAALVDPVGDHQRLVPDPAGLADPFHLGVQPQVRVAALQRPLPERPHLLIQPTAQPRYLVLGHAGDAELLDQPIHPTGADAVDVGLLHHRDQRLLGPPARLQERREVAAGPQPGNAQLQLPDPGVPGSWPVAVTLGHPVRGALAELGTDLGRNLGLHQLRDHPRHALAQHVGVLAGQQLVGNLRSGHPGAFGHRGAPFVDLVEQTDDSQAPRWPNSHPTASPPTPHSATRPAP
jgi:hypothetical protein